jgi:acetyltransferase EpsM
VSSLQTFKSKASALETGSEVRRILIIGAGGHGSELQSYLTDLQATGGRVSLAGFIDENKLVGGWNGSLVLGDLSHLQQVLDNEPKEEWSFITAVGDNEIRRRLVDRIQSMFPELSAWTLRHPQSIVGNNNEIGEGTCLAPGSIVTTNARIGSHCILNVNASVSHDSIVGDFANINPGAVVAGNVQVGTGAYIGAGATLIDKVKVGEWSVIGAGAVVIDDIPPYTTAVGVPAKVISRHE